MRRAPHREEPYKRGILVNVLIACPHCDEMVRLIVRWDGRTYRTCPKCFHGFAIFPTPDNAYRTEIL